MIDPAVGFGCVAALLWGLSPVLSKRGFTTGGTPLLATLALVAIGTGGLWLLSLGLYGTDGLAVLMNPAAAAPFVAGGVVGTGVGRLLNYSGVDRLGASVNSAGVATDPVFATGIGVVALNESVTTVQAFGVCVVVVGLAVTVLSGGGNERGWPWWALIFPLGAGLAYGAGAVVRRFGLLSTHVAPVQAAAVNEVAAFVALGAYAVVRLDRTALGEVTLRSYTYLIAAGVVNTAGLVSFFVAIDSGPVVIASTLAGMSTLVTVAGSAVLLDGVETVTMMTGVGAAVTVAGASLVV